MNRPPPARAAEHRPDAHPEPAAPAAGGNGRAAAAGRLEDRKHTKAPYFVPELQRELILELPETFTVSDDEIDLFGRLFGDIVNSIVNEKDLPP